MTEDMDNSSNWNGPRFMSQQLYTFADTWFESIGKNRSFKRAAMEAGVENEGSARQLGHKWSQFTAVKNYWASLEEVNSGVRRLMHLEALKRQEEFAVDDKIPLEVRIAINNTIIDKTAPSIYPTNLSSKSSKSASTVDAEDEPRVVEDEDTSNSMSVIYASIKAQANKVGEVDG